MLEDYQQNPAGANALVTLSVFDDLVDEHNIGLLRGDIINNGISEVEGEKVIKSVFDAYTIDDTFNRDVFTFNKVCNYFNSAVFLLLCNLFHVSFNIVGT